MKQLAKVLIGDDTLNYGLICKEMLQKEDLEVKTVPKDGMEVYQGILQYRPDIVVMECYMPHIDAIGILSFRRHRHFVLCQNTDPGAGLFGHQRLRQQPCGKGDYEPRCGGVFAAAL